ncbi:MAG TPA: LacI family DNA-binding transcriptional regulator [Acidobacteriaceae bacterium]|jgi:LacI family transcriptional regulator
MNIREVAKKAGVSIATVSRVVNGTARVHARTEQRVRAAIERTGYYPNTHARTLGTGKSHIYGLIISDLENPFFPELVKCFERVAVEHGQEVLIANTDYHPERMHVCVRRMLERKVDGVAIMTSEMDPELIRMLSRRGIPIVFLDTGLVGRKVSNICIDYRGGIDLAIGHLTSLDHRRIAFVSGPVNLASARIRHDAFLTALRRKKLKCSPDFIREGNHRFDGGQAAMIEMLKLRVLPTAVLASNDLTAIGIMGAIQAAGLRVPDDISVVGFDDIALSSFMQPPLTTIRLPRAEIAEWAFTSLYAASHRGDNQGITHMVTTELVIRQSTGKVRR